MQLTHQFQGQMVKGQGYRRVGAYRVGQTQQPHCLLTSVSAYDGRDNSGPACQYIHRLTQHSGVSVHSINKRFSHGTDRQTDVRGITHNWPPKGGQLIILRLLSAYHKFITVIPYFYSTQLGTKSTVTVL